MLCIAETGCFGTGPNILTSARVTEEPVLGSGQTVDNLAIFPALFFRCSGFLTHMRMVTNSRDVFCGTNDNIMNVAFKFDIHIWQPLDNSSSQVSEQNSQYQYIDKYEGFLSAGQISGQCQEETQDFITLDFSLETADGLKPHITPGYVVGLQLPSQVTIDVQTSGIVFTVTSEFSLLYQQTNVESLTVDREQPVDQDEPPSSTPSPLVPMETAYVMATSSFLAPAVEFSFDCELLL